MRDYEIRTMFLRYGVAVLAVLAATWLRLALDAQISGQFPFVIFFIAVVVTAWLAGAGPTLWATLLSVVSVVLLFLAPDLSAESLGTSDIIGLALFVCFGLITAGLAGLARRSKQQLRGERERFLVTLASIGDGVIVTDTDARVTFVNEIGETLTGWRAEDASGRPLGEVFEIVNEATGEPTDNPVKRVLEAGAIVGLANHTILIDREGRRRAIDDSAAPIRKSGGHIVGVVLVFRDVTEKRKFETAQQRLAAVVESSGDAILGQTLDGTVTAWNRAAERLFGFTAQEVVGRLIFETICPADRKEEHLAVLQQVGRGERVDHFLTIRRTKGGDEIPVSIRLSPIRDEHGEIIGASAIDRDISQQVMAERRRNARLAVTQALSEETDIDRAVPRILQAICEELQWEAGAFWRIDRDGESLRCQAFWQDPSRDYDRFQQHTSELVFKPGTSLPGRVWGSGQPVWVEDVAEDPDFVRGATAREEDLHGAFACPVSLKDDFLGVLEFFSGSIQSPDEDLLELAATIGNQIAQFIERREAEAELRRSEQELSDFFNNATMGLHWVGPDGTILRANRAELELLGYSEEEYVGHHIAEFHVDEPVINDILERLAAGEKLDRYQARMRCKDGSIVQVLINSNVLFEDGEFIHTRCFTRDISDQMRLEAELHQRLDELTEAESRIRSVVDHVIDGIITIDSGGVVESMNPAAEKIFGYAAEGVIGRNVKTLMPQPYRDEHDGYIDNYLQTGEKKIIGIGREVSGRRKDGSTFPMDLAVSEFKLNDRRFFTGIVRDITDRKQIENALRFMAEASRLLTALTDSRSTLQKMAHLAVPQFADWCAVHLLAPDDGVELLALNHADAEKVRLARMLYEQYGPRPEDDYGAMHVLRSGEPLMVPEIREEDLATLARDEKHLSMLKGLNLRSYMCVPLEVNQRTVGTLSFVSAESERRYRPEDLEMVQDLAYRTGIAMENARLYEELRDADRRKDEFLAMLAHELRNPLAPIRTGLDILAMQHGTDSKTIDTMQNQVVHLVRLVDDLLDVSRIMRGRVELRKEMVELRPLVEQSIEAIQPLMDEREQELEISLPEETVSLYADPVRLVQVVENLLSNASKYTESGGCITLIVKTEDDMIEITVQDTGIGIEPDLLPHIFDLFTQSSRSLERSQGGLGIGLTLVRQLVHLHGGKVRAYSAGPGEGSEFVVRLPVSRKRVPRESKEADEGDAREHRILVVDDNVEAAQMLSMLLQSIGDHELEVAHDGPSAIRKMEALDPEIVLLDIGLPGMDGYEVAREIRDDPRYSDTLLVAVTGYGQEEDRRKSKEAGFDEHLVKPLSSDQVRSLLVHPKLNPDVA